MTDTLIKMTIMWKTAQENVFQMILYIFIFKPSVTFWTAFVVELKSLRFDDKALTTTWVT